MLKLTSRVASAAVVVLAVLLMCAALCAADNNTTETNSSTTLITSTTTLSPTTTTSRTTTTTSAVAGTTTTSRATTTTGAGATTTTTRADNRTTTAAASTTTAGAGATTTTRAENRTTTTAATTTTRPPTTTTTANPVVANASAAIDAARHGNNSTALFDLADRLRQAAAGGAPGAAPLAMDALLQAANMSRQGGAPVPPQARAAILDGLNATLRAARDDVRHNPAAFNNTLAAIAACTQRGAGGAPAALTPNDVRTALDVLGALTDDDTRRRVSAAAVQVAGALGAAAVSGAAPVVVTTAAGYKIAARALAADAAGGAPITVGDAQMQLPSGFAVGTPGQKASLMATALPGNPQGSSGAPADGEQATTVVDFSVLLDGAPHAISGVGNGIQLGFSATPAAAAALAGGDTKPVCMYWDPATSAWSTNGVTTGAVSTVAGTTTLSCTTTHLSTYTVFTAPDGDAAKKKSVVGLAVGVTIALIVVIVVVVLVARHRRNQQGSGQSDVVPKDTTVVAVGYVDNNRA